MATNTSAVPAPAAAAGYDAQTFGPAVTLKSNWQKFDFYGIDPGTVDATQNADGSVTIDGGGDNFGAQISSASVGSSPNSFQGIAFGGGGYFQATMSFDGPASFWANDIETMNGISTGGGPNQWPGQAPGYGDWIEPDFAEFDSTGVYGLGIHNWFGTVGSGNDTNTGPISGSPVSPAGADYSKPNTYGFLWVPATATTQGYAKYYFNGVQVGNTITWNQYDPSAGPAPSISDGTAFSVLDKLHLALILGTGSSGTSNTVYSVSVWQKSAADDISTLPTDGGGGGPTPPPAPPPVPSPNRTEITSASDAPIIDQAGNAWTLVQSASQGLQIAVNGTVDPVTNSVVLLEILNGDMVQENSHGDWYSESRPSGPWSKIPAPNPPVLPSTVTVGSGSDTLVLSISEDAWANGDGTSDPNGDAAFTVAVDGNQIGGTFFAQALHAADAAQSFDIKGNWAPGVHTVTVSFINDAYDGSATTDRNLYVNDITYDGTDTGQQAAFYGAGSQNFKATDNTPIPAPVAGAGADSMVLQVSEDYYLGDAKFTVSIDGKQIGGTFTASVRHSSGTYQTFAFAGDFGSGTHAVSVDFLNDRYAGSPSTDRNLYVNDVLFNGTDTGQSAALKTQGKKNLSVTGGTTQSVTETSDHGSLQKNLTQTGTYAVGDDSFVLSSGNAVSVTIGSGVSRINFIGASAITLTGGSGQATVIADTGNNSFIAGTGSLDVTGGAGKAAYVYHATSGVLTIEDFSLAKGDTLTIDKTLLGSRHQASDGMGGTMLTFGVAGHAVDLRGVASISSSNILQG